MTFMEVLFGKRTGDLEKLAKQAEQMDAVHEILKGSSAEIDLIKNQLVRKANGSLYPHLANAGVKLREP